MTHLEITREILSSRLNNLTEEDVHEVLDFIEFLKIREEQWFINYINQRTTEALLDRENGKRFFSLEELQKEVS